jgi:plastocyanin
VRTSPLLPVALSLLVFTAASCGGDDDANSTSAPPAVTEAPVATDPPAADTAATDTGAAAPAMDAAVEIADFAFGPADVTIAVGGTVTWTNTDDQAHTATSSGNFDTGSIAAGATAGVTFDQPGTFTYICSFHPFMTATITVV